MLASHTRRRLAPAALALAAGLAVPAFAGPAAAAESPDVQKQLDALKSAYAKYKDPAVAIADGFAKTDDCAESPDGVMGYHYVNEKLVMAPVDQMKPPVVIYQPDGKGGRKLVAVEYFKPDADQNLATSDDKPSLYGRPFDGPMEGHAPGMPKHYDMHVWLYMDNPKGTFAQWNPAGTCKTGDTGGSGGSGGGGGQVSDKPTGGAAAGEGGTAGTENAWLFTVGAAAAAAGAVALGAGARAARRRG